jgi:hypothetical protein
MEDYAFGTIAKREAAKTKNMLKGNNCDTCEFLHDNAKQPGDGRILIAETWCRKKSDRPKERVCEWYEDEDNTPKTDRNTSIKRP